MCSKCEIQLSYAIGVEDPVSINVNTFGTNHSKHSDEELAELLFKNYSFRPKDMIANLKLDEVDYSEITTTGQFGNDIYPWEYLDVVEEFKHLDSVL